MFCAGRFLPGFARAHTTPRTSRFLLRYASPSRSYRDGEKERMLRRRRRTDRFVSTLSDLREEISIAIKVSSRATLRLRDRRRYIEILRWKTNLGLCANFIYTHGYFITVERGLEYMR